MNNGVIIFLAMFAWFAFDHLVSEVCSVLRARAKPPACPCQGVPAFVISADGETHPFTPASPEAAARKVH